MKLLLDTGILGQLCHPAREKHRRLAIWLAGLLISDDPAHQVILPEICDYELRRKLHHLVAKSQSDDRSLRRLDELGRLLDYLPLDTETMKKAAALWAAARQRGRPTAADPAIDGDVILAAQAILVGGIIVTSNRKHLDQFVPTQEWTEI